MGLIDEGERAPLFTLLDQQGKKRVLKDYAGQPVVLFFYPKDNTSGCTKQACALRDAMPDFEELECAVLGVSPQDVESKAKFASDHDLNFPVLADDDAKVCDKYGAWQEKSMYGNTYMGVVRTTYVIAPNGKVAARFDKVRVPEHIKKVKGALAALTQSK